MRKVNLYELMTNNYMHNQYMYGAYRHYNNFERQYIVLKGVRLEDYIKKIIGSKERINLKYYKRFFSILLLIMYDILRGKNKVVITGARTHWIIIFCFLNWAKNVDVHVHGQFYGSQNSKIKYLLWQFIGGRVDIKLANMFYSGKIKVEKLSDIHNIPEESKFKVTKYNRENKKVVGVLSGKGRSKWKGLEDLKFLKLSGLEVKIYKASADIDREWDNYLQFFRDIDFLFLNPTNDYYLFSPSGILTDSKNYEKPLVAYKDNQNVECLIKKGLEGVYLISKC